MDNIGLFDRSAVAAAGLSARGVRRHELDGVLLPVDARDRARARAHRSGLGRHRHQVPRALPRRSRTRCGSSARPTSRCGTTRTASSTTSSSTRTAAASGCGCGRMTGLLPILAVAHAPAWVADELPDFTSRLRWLQLRRPDLLDGLLAEAGAADQPGKAMLSLLDVTGPAPRAAPDVRRGRVPVAARHPIAVGGLPHPVHAGDRRPAALDRLRAGRVDATRCSAATRTGAARSGSRSTCCSPTRCAPTPTTSVTTETFEVPTGSGSQLTLVEAADLLDARLVDLFRRGPDGRRPVDGARIEASDDPLWREHIDLLASTSTATPARVWAPRTRPAGPRWSPTCSAAADDPATAGADEVVASRHAAADGRRHGLADRLGARDRPDLPSRCRAGGVRRLPAAGDRGRAAGARAATTATTSTSPSSTASASCSRRPPGGPTPIGDERSATTGRPRPGQRAGHRVPERARGDRRGRRVSVISGCIGPRV